MTRVGAGALHRARTQVIVRESFALRGIIVIPTYNERQNVPLILNRIWRAAPDIDVLFVDDNSPDGTRDVIESFRQQHPTRVFLLPRPRKEGLGKAYVAAFQQVLSMSYDFVVHMDADLSHDPAEIPAMIEALQRHDVVLGSRYCDGIRVVGWGFRRLILSKWATWYVTRITGMRLTDATSGFRCWRTSALAKLGMDRLSSHGYLILVEMAFWAWRLNFRITELPIIFYERRFGKSKIDPTVLWESATGVLALRWRFNRRQKAIARRAASS